mgnify:FL=1
MLKIGCHLSVAKGYAAMANDAVKIGADVFQFFSRNPRGGKAREIDLDDINKFKDICEKSVLGPFLVHAPYTLNPCSKDEKTRSFALEAMSGDIERLDTYFGGGLYNFHPGSHVGQGIDEGVRLIAETINKAVKADSQTTILLETMAGKGTEVGGKFEELRRIIDLVDERVKIGVCMDTCHVFDAGYDIVNNIDSVLEEFDSVVGIERLKAVHINDTMNPIGSHKDRHQKIGQGFIGIETFERIINHPYLKNLPFYLETPNELEGYAEEIRLLKSLSK